jgi:hypothetical protein
MPLGRPLNLNAFLFGCLDFTEAEPLEHLIIGFGTAAASTTRVEALSHTVGSTDSVPIHRETWEAAEDWLKRTPRGQVILVHNHPRNFLNRLFDNPPLASGTDRYTWVTSFLRFGTAVRFYLIENGVVRQFRTPMLPRLAGQLQARLRAAGT